MKPGATFVLVFSLVAALVYVFMWASQRDTAELVLALRADGELVHARIAEHVEVAVGTRRSGRSTESLIRLEGSLGSGAAWETTMTAARPDFAGEPVGETLDVIVLSTDPARCLRASDVERADASGHHRGETVESVGSALFLAGCVGGIAAVAVHRRGRR